LIGKVGTGHKKVNTAGKIIYLSNADRAGQPHVWIVNSDGSDAKDLTPGSQTCADPVFSPDGSQIAYISDKDGSAQVYLMDADGTLPHAITFGTAAKGDPQFSSDGSTLSFLTQGTLTAIDLQSKDTQMLLPPPTAATSSATSALIDVSHAPVIKYAWAPSPSTNSNKQPSIAAVQDSEDGSLEVLGLLPTLNSQPKYLMIATNVSVAWSPDGSELYAAILGGKVGPNHSNFSGIISFSASGDPIQKAPLAAAPSATEGPAYPTVSPDGTQIMFSALNETNIANVQTIGIFIQPTDGSAPPKRLIAAPAMGARWAPDGSEVLLLIPNPKTEKHDLWVAKLDGSSQPLDLTKGAGNVTSAQFSPTITKSAANGSN
jgi:Tol biopolymer transport system component